MYNDKRRHQRQKMIAEVFYKDEKKQTFGGCVAKNVSESGVCLSLGEFFPVGTVLDLQFKLPLSETAFYVKAKIMRINKTPFGEQWEAGLEMKVDAQYAKRVQEYIAIQNSQKKEGTGPTAEND